MLTQRLAQAGTINLAPTGEFVNVSTITIGSIISAIVTFILIAAAVIFFFMLVLGGIRYITSGGDKAQTEGARGQITAAVIGLAVVFGAWAVITIVNAFFGVNILQLVIPSAQPGSSTSTNPNQP